MALLVIGHVNEKKSRVRWFECISVDFYTSFTQADDQNHSRTPAAWSRIVTDLRQSMHIKMVFNGDMLYCSIIL